MSKTLYRGHRFSPGIEAVEVIHETAKFVTVREPHHYTPGKFIESRRQKVGHFDTWEGCKAALVERQQRVVEAYKLQLHQARTRLGMLEAMQPPVASGAAEGSQT